MGRFCILFLLLGRLDCSRVLTDNTANDDFESLGKVNVSMETGGFENGYRYRLQNVFSFNYLNNQVWRASTNHVDEPSHLERLTRTLAGDSWRDGQPVQLKNTATEKWLLYDSHAQFGVAFDSNPAGRHLWYAQLVPGLHDVVTLRCAQEGKYLVGVTFSSGDSLMMISHLGHSHPVEKGHWKLIYVAPSPPPPPTPLTVRGYWMPVTDIHSAVTHIHSRTTSRTVTQGSGGAFSVEAQTSVSAGFECVGANVAASVAASVGRDLSTAIEFSHLESESRLQTDKFIPYPEASQNVSGNYDTGSGLHLWQWVFDYFRDDQLQSEGTTFTSSFAQTANPDQIPACLPGYARDPYNGYQDCVTDHYRITPHHV